MRRMGRSLLMVMLALAYVLGVKGDASNRKYKEGDRVPLYADKVGSFHNPSDEKPRPTADELELARKKLPEFPIGYDFSPYDDELITDYLLPKLKNLPLPYNIVNDVKLYDYNPRDLAEIYKKWGENKWYFFTARDRKYPKGSRPSRSAGDGYWKATGSDMPIKDDDGNILGQRKSLVFYHGKQPKGTKSDWSMHEYTIAKSCRGSPLQLDEWVLCAIYKKKASKADDSNNNPQPANHRHEDHDAASEAAMENGESTGTAGEAPGTADVEKCKRQPKVQQAMVSLAQIALQSNASLDTSPGSYSQHNMSNIAEDVVVGRASTLESFGLESASYTNHSMSNMENTIATVEAISGTPSILPGSYNENNISSVEAMRETTIEFSETMDTRYLQDRTRCDLFCPGLSDMDTFFHEPFFWDTTKNLQSSATWEHNFNFVEEPVMNYHPQEVQAVQERLPQAEAQQLTQRNSRDENENYITNIAREYINR